PRPAAAAPASVATRATSFALSGPLSSQTTIAPISERATSQTDTLASPAAARTRAPANATAAAPSTICPCLYKDGLAPERDRPVCNGRREGTIVGDDERRPLVRLRAEQLRQRALPLG